MIWNGWKLSKSSGENPSNFEGKFQRKFERFQEINDWFSDGNEVWRSAKNQRKNWSFRKLPIAFYSLKPKNHQFGCVFYYFGWNDGVCELFTNFARCNCSFTYVGIEEKIRRNQRRIVRISRGRIARTFSLEFQRNCGSICNWFGREY